MVSFDLEQNNKVWHNDWCNRARDISYTGRKEENFAIPHFNNKETLPYVLRTAETVMS